MPKYRLVDKPGKLPDIAVGMTNVATGQRAQPYAVATTQPGAIGVSLGLTRPTARGFVGMGGVAYNLNPNTQLVADFIEGRSNYTTYGAIVSVTKTISVNVAYARPNGGNGLEGGGVTGSPRGFVLNVAYVFHALHSKNGGGEIRTRPLPVARAYSTANQRSTLTVESGVHPSGVGEGRRFAHRIAGRSVSGSMMPSAMA